MQPSPKRRWGVVLLGMGGPATLDDIEPFLIELFSDPAIMGIPFAFLRRAFARRIARRRTPLVRPRYERIGGGSPLVANTRVQARALGERLNSDCIPVEIAMRYTPPFPNEAIGAFKAKGVTHVIALPMYPQACRSTTGTSLVHFSKAALTQGLQVITIEGFADLEGYIQAMRGLMAEKLAGFDHPLVIFSAHGLPESIAQSDPYPEQTRRTAQLLADSLPEGTPWKLAFQSRVGPVKWLEPHLDETILDAARNESPEILVVPLSFVSEHIETLHELDIEIRELALESGAARYERTPTVSSHPLFINGLAGLVREAIREFERVATP